MFHRHEDGNQDEENDDQEVDFLCAQPLGASIGIEVVFVQTHIITPWKLFVSLGRFYTSVVKQRLASSTGQA